MALIEYDLNAIRTGVSGKEVREAIADGLEQCYGNSTASSQIAQIIAEGTSIREALSHDFPEYSELVTEVNDLNDVLKDHGNTVYDFMKGVQSKIRIANDFVNGERYLAGSGFAHAEGYARSRFAYPAGKYILGAFNPGYIAVEYISDSEGSSLINNWVASRTVINATRSFYITFNAVNSTETFNNINKNFSVERVINETGETVQDTLDGMVITEKSANLFNGRFVNGEQVATSSGAFIDGSGYARTDYIPIKRGTVHIGIYGALTTPSTVFVHCAFYNITKNKVSAFPYTGITVNSANDLYYQTITAEEDGFIAFDIYSASLSGPWQYYVSQVTTPSGYTAYYEPLKSIHPKLLHGSTPRRTTKTSFSGGETMVVESNSIMKNQKILFFAKVSVFNYIEIGHGTGEYGYYIKIDQSKLYYMSNNTVGTSVNHGLTISDYIFVSIDVNAAGVATIVITTMNGTFTDSRGTWTGRKGDIFVRSNGSALMNAELTWLSNDYDKAVWAFGDSYFNTTANARWPYWVVNGWGWDTMLLNGYPGEASANAYNDLVTALTHGTPKYILWCIGMNDHDSSTGINAVWKQTVEAIMQICDRKGIELILSTTPQVTNTSYNNSFKNAYVQASAYRYVDFAGAVQGLTGGSWLDTDGVHTNVSGAMLLASKAIADFPELIQEN